MDETNTLAGPVCFDKTIDLGWGFERLLVS
jgi:hypothetical protein